MIIWRWSNRARLQKEWKNVLKTSVCLTLNQAGDAADGMLSAAGQCWGFKTVKTTS